MGNRGGQATTEFVMMLAILTLTGIIFLRKLAGPGTTNGNPPAIKTAENKAIENIQNDN